MTLSFPPKHDCPDCSQLIDHSDPNLTCEERRAKSDERMIDIWDRDAPCATDEEMERFRKILIKCPRF